MSARRRVFNQGWWSLQRDRFQVTDEFPPVPFNERKMSELLPDVLDKVKMRQDAWLLRIVAVWDELVGDSLAASTRPGNFDHGTLTVYVRHSIFLHELSRNGKNQILKKLQEQFGAAHIRQIVLRLDPDNG